MGCLMIGVSALLAFAVPASIARASLLGAYLVIALLALLALATVVLRGRGRRAEPATARSGAAVWIVVLSLLYAGTVTVIHATA